MSKLNLTDIESGYNLATAYNANNDTIEAAFDNMLSRDGSSPNHMLASLDMNSFAINNLKAATQANQAVNLAQLTAAQFAGVSSGDAQFVESYSALKALNSPSTGDVTIVTAEWLNGIFVYDETASSTRIVGMNEPPDDATPGAWVRRRQGFVNVRWFGATGDGGTDDVEAIEAAIRYCADSNYTNQDAVLYFPAGDYLISRGITFDRGGITFLGEGRHNGSNIKASTSMEYMLRHQRSSGNSSGVHFFHIRLNGQDFEIDRALYLQAITYGHMLNFEIRQVSGTALYGAYLQDWYMDLHVHRCGREYEVTETGSINSSDQTLTLSATSDFLIGDYVKVAGAGAGGATLESAMDGSLVTNTMELAQAAGTTVSGATVTRVLPAVNLHNLYSDGLSELTTICNSIVFAPYSTFERNHAMGIALYKADAITFTHTKHHGRLVADGDPGGPAELDLIVADRCERIRFIDLQVISPQRSAIVLKATTGVDASATILGGWYKDVANYQTATDCQFIKQEGGHLRIANVSFDDDLAHSSYTTNGIDVNVTGGTISGGVVECYGSPGGGYFANVDNTNGSVMVSRPGRPHYVKASVTPTLKFGGGNAGMVMAQNTMFEVKVGNVVQVWVRLRMSNKGTSTGDATVDGLTWNLSNETGMNTMEWPMTYDDWSVRMLEATKEIKFWEPSTSTAKTDADFAIDTNYFLTFSYIVKD